MAEAIPRDVQAIKQRIVELGEDPVLDPGGIERSRLLEALPFSDAATWLTAGNTSTPKDWEEQRPRTKAELRQQITAYLPFAWSKANQKRGISAHRSLAHFKGLLYLIGPEHDELRAWIGTEEHYGYYGKPQLVRISELVDFPWKDHDNDEWCNGEEEEPVTAAEVLGEG